MSVPKRVAILGAGEIGSGWAALFAAYGSEVRIFDRDENAESKARAALTDAVRIGVGVDHLGSIDSYFDLDDAIEGAEWVQESLPEERRTKRDYFESLERSLAAETVVASSSSTFTPSETADGLSFADRFLVAHPLHPVYAVPVVELCGGELTAPAIVEKAAEVMRSLGREPVVLRREVTGLVTNRLTAALLREAFDLVAAGVVTPDDLDRAVSRGIALGWGAAGPFATEAIGAGNAGFAGFLDRFEEPLRGIWASLAQWTSLGAERRKVVVEMIGDRDVSRVATARVTASNIRESWSNRITAIARAARHDRDA